MAYKHLLEDFSPSHYKIDLAINAEALTFEGVVVITGDIHPSKSSIYLHSKGLNISEVVIGEQPVKSFSLKESQDLLDINVGTIRGSHDVEVRFNGVISDEMHGIYPCRYQEDGSEKLIIATQFESHHAREAFPCVDEPAAKASFELSLTTTQQQVVVSNTELVSDSKTKKGFSYRFDVTPKMSTYLLAFVMGDLAQAETTNKHGIKVRTLSSLQNIEHTKFALKVAADVLDFYQDYFKIDYPLPKCDLISLPEFDAGAMENWGCITFRESAMLVDKANTSITNKQYVALVIAHELAHQWFGNLVTMKWWTDLWLNEGFATWMEYFVIDKLYPEWGLWMQFLLDETTPALKLDSLKSTHPIVVPIDDPDDISSIFDSISYNKGASVIRMLHDFVGPDNFKKGLREYLLSHQYTNAETNDLWASLSKASGLDVAKFMQSWTNSAGYPVVNVDVADGITLSQHRFSLLPNSDKEPLWHIPLYNNDLSADVLTESSTQMTVSSNEKSYVLLNQSAAGFYRVAYPKNTIKIFEKDFAGPDVAPISKLSILNDTFELTKTGDSNLNSAFGLMVALKQDDNALIWQAIASHIGAINQLTTSTKTRNKLKDFTRQLIKYRLVSLSWQPAEGESVFDVMLRQTIIGLGIFSNETSVTDKAGDIFKAYTASESQIDPDLRSLVYRAAVINHGSFDLVMDRYKETNFAEESNRLAGALCQAEKLDEINKCLDMINSKYVRQQDIVRWIAVLMANPAAKQLCWDWAKQNWKWLNSTLHNTMAIAKMPLYLAAITGVEFTNDYRKFFDANSTPNMSRAIANGLEQIEWRSAWQERTLPELDNLLTESIRQLEA